MLYAYVFFLPRPFTVLPINSIGLTQTYFNRRCSRTGKLTIELTLIVVLPLRCFFEGPSSITFFQKLEFLLDSKYKL